MSDLLAPDPLGDGGGLAPDPLAPRRRASDPAQRVAELEALQQQFGAPEIEQDSPGMFRQVIDLLSRFEFAEAGFLEEIVSGKGLGAAFGRAGTEFFSGIGGLKGQKQGFGEVLEDLGVGDLGRLSNAFPALKDSFFDITGRGTVGLFMAIAGDPLTWIGSPKAAAAAAGRVVTEKGVRTFVSKAGFKRLGKELKSLLPEDETGRILLEGATDEARAVALGAARTEAADRLNRGLIDELASEPVKTQARAVGALADPASRQSKSILNSGKPEATALKKIIGIDGFDPRPFDVIVNEAVERDARAMVRQGVEITDPLNAAVRKAARVEADKRVIAAIKSGDDALLDPGGLRFMGFTLPGSPQAATMLSGVSAKVVEAVGKTRAGGAVLQAGQEMKPAFDALGALFHRDFKTRGIKGFNVLKQVHIDAHVAEVGRTHVRIQEALKGFKKAERSEISKAIDTGTIASLDPRLQQAAAEVKRLNDEWVLGEVRAGLIDPATVRENYIAHFYENSPTEISQVVEAWAKKSGKNINRATVGRHAEERAFATFDEAVAVSTMLHAENASIPILRPITDAAEIMRRRGERHVDSLVFQEWYATVAKEFGEDIPFLADDAIDAMTHPLQVVNKETQDLMAKITKQVNKGGTKVEFVAGLSAVGRKEFLAQRFARVTSRDELGKTMRKYWDFTDDFPKGARPVGESVDGVAMATIALPGLAGIPIPRPIADDLGGMTDKILNSRELGVMTRGYDTLTNFFKRMVTVYFPAFSFRNAYSNVVQSFYDIGVSALNPKMHKETVRVLGRLPNGKFWIKDGIFETDLGENIPLEIMRRELKDNGVSVDFRSFTEQTGRADKSLALRHGPASLIRKGAIGIENEARALHYLTLRRRGMAPDAAAERMKQFVFDYSNLSPFEQEVMRRAIPFYVWTRKNIELQLRQLATRPGRVINAVRPFRGRDEENQQMISWEGEALKIRLGRDGNTVRMLTGVDLPVKGLDVIWRGSVAETLRQNLGMLNPILKAPVEIASGRNLFTGRGLRRQESASIGRVVEQMPRPVKNWMGYKKQVDAAGRPSYSFDGERFYLLFQSFAFSRFVSTTDRQFREFINDDQWGRALLDVATGLRLKDLNMDEQQERMLKERIRQLQASLVRRGVGAEFNRFFEPKDRGELQ